MTRLVRWFTRAVISPLFFCFRLVGFCVGLLVGLSFASDLIAASQVCIRNVCFNVEVASTPAQRETGLMNRRYLDRHAGMWFVFDRSDRYVFWMKDTLLSLDIIWVDEFGHVVDIVHRATPGSLIPMIPSKSARHVLEINGGVANTHRFRKGDKVVFKQ